MTENGYYSHFLKIFLEDYFSFLNLGSYKEQAIPRYCFTLLISFENATFRLVSVYVFLHTTPIPSSKTRDNSHIHTTCFFLINFPLEFSLTTTLKPENLTF